MDRREALKKLAAGGAAAAGATAVLSSTAFADGGSDRSRPTPSISEAFVRNNANSATVTFTFARVTCPYTTNGISHARIDVAVTQTAGNATVTGTITPYSTGTNTGETASRIAPVNITWASDRTVTFRVDTRYVCKGRPNGTVVAWRCLSQTVTYTVANNGDLSNSPALTTVGEISACNGTPPTL